MKIDKKHEDWENYFNSYGWVVRVRSVKAGDLEGLMEAAKEFKEVFEEANKKIG